MNLEATLQFANQQVGKREEGRNAGPFVTRILANVGLGPGFPWCAAFVRWVLDSTGMKHIGPRKGAARVKIWADWAKENGKVIPEDQVRRHDLFYWLNSDGTGHIGFVCERYFSVAKQAWVIRTIEGNTSDGGSRDGDGTYKRVRRSSGVKFIRLV